MHHVFTLARKLTGSTKTLGPAVGTTAVATSMVTTSAYGKASATASTRHVPVHSRATGIVIVEAATAASHASSRLHTTTEMTAERKKRKKKNEKMHI